MKNSCYAYLSQEGVNQVLTIPDEFTLSSAEVLLTKEGNRLIIEPINSNSLLSLLATLEDITEDFADVDEGLQPLDNITF